MGDVVLRAVDLGKRYRIGERERYRALRDVISAAGTAPLRRIRPRSKPITEVAHTIWALREMSFDLTHGEALGIVGRNGAGKSTLLKILARITEPTEGHAVITGRVGSLLEVGTGFHPELTGRENVALNGAILGMRRAEIGRRFDEIVEFAGVGRFIDTPVKRYSTGMRARLAFAVAAHLEPDILIVDEVLAVGDAEFQRRCMARMGAAARGGRTVLFVSHNLAAVEALCSRALWIDAGRTMADGRPGDVISRYLSSSASAQIERVWDETMEAGDCQVRMCRGRVRTEGDDRSATIYVTTPFVIEFEYWNLHEGARLNLSLHIYNQTGVMVLNALPSEEQEWQGRPFPRGLFRDTCHIPGDLFNDGQYSVELLVVKDRAEVVLRFEDVLTFEVRDGASRGPDGVYESWAGTVRPRLAWETALLGD